MTLNAAITPTARDLAEVRVVVLDRLQSERSMSTTALLTAVFEAAGLSRESLEERISTEEQPPWRETQNVDPVAPAIRARRSRAAGERDDQRRPWSFCTPGGVRASAFPVVRRERS